MKQKRATYKESLEQSQMVSEPEIAYALKNTEITQLRANQQNSIIEDDITMEQSISLDEKKQNLMQMIMSLDTDSTLDKVAKYITRLIKDGKTQDISTETMAMIEQSRREFKEGKVVSFDSASDAQKWLESL